MSSKLQLTLALLKPDVIAQPYVAHEIRHLILKNNFYFVRSKNIHLKRHDAEQFYAEHKGKFFYERLVGYMSSGPISSHILARFDAIQGWRELMGPTKVFKTVYSNPDSIRGRFGLTDTRNCTHGADSEVSASNEIAYFFPNFDEAKWFSSEELAFRQNKVVFNEEQWLHIPH